MENLIKMDDLGVPLFSETLIYTGVSKNSGVFPPNDIYFNRGFHSKPSMLKFWGVSLFSETPIPGTGDVLYLPCLGESLQNKVLFEIRRRVIWVPGIYILYKETYKHII